MDDSSVQVTRTRLLSLDVMRGLDMFFLVVVGPVLGACERIWGVPAWLATQLRHVAWEGLTAWDLIMTSSRVREYLTIERCIRPMKTPQIQVRSTAT